LAFGIIGYLVYHSFAATPPANNTPAPVPLSYFQSQIQALEKSHPGFSAAVSATQKYNQQYRQVWVKPGTDFAAAIAQAKANGVNVVSQLPALGMYTVTATTAN